MARRSRFRLTIARLMLAVLILGPGLGWAINRPYPVGWWAVGGAVMNDYYMSWSDRTTTQEYGPNVITIRGNSWFRAVDFPDGRTRYYLILR